MRAKSRKKPARSVRYLLSADRKLRRIRLRKMADRSARPKARGRVPKAKAAAKSGSDGHTPWTRSHPAVLAMIGVVVAIAVITVGQPSQRANLEPADVLLEPEAPEVSPVAARLDARESGAPSRPAVEPAPRTLHAADAPAPLTRVSRSASTAEGPAPVGPNPARPSVEAGPPDPVVRSIATEPPEPTGITISGCLELDKQTFWLKDTSGVDVPTSRSWKTGFLRKRSASVALVDTTNALRLTSHVGQRIAVTGTFVDRELRAHSLRTVDGACR